jgi:membrane fusion protein (multidrug efflux system)
MAFTFTQTLRSLKSDRPTRYYLAMAVACALLVAWGTWMMLAEIPVYEATSEARLEVQQASHQVQSPVAGRITQADLRLGREVAVGDVLFELDASAQRLELEQARARLGAIGPEIAAAKKELDAQQQAVTEDTEGVGATVAEAKAKLQEAQVSEEHAEEQLARARKLRADGLLSESDLEQAKAELSQKKAATEAARMAVGKTGASGRAELSDRRAKKESLAREIAVLEGEVKTTGALIDRLEHEISLRTVRAGVAGQLAEVAPITVGSVLREGDKVGAIVPQGELRIVAEFPPPRALGRIRVDQPARLRLDGFPWAQHGTVSARVARVASEVREGQVRVELDVLPGGAASAVPLQHGLPGRLEIEVERTSPFTLLLRAAGKAADDPQQQPTEPSASPPSSEAP